jgi:hypothetical protein
MQKGETEMKKQAYTMMAMLVLVGSMAVAAQAQTSGRTQLTANIPFQFSVGDKNLPAGEYTVVQVNPTSDRAVLQLRSNDGSATAMVQMNSVSGKSQDTAQLIFHRYGNKYFFAQAWVGAEGLQAAKPRAERIAERELAAGIKATNETVALSARK